MPRRLSSSATLHRRFSPNFRPSSTKRAFNCKSPAEYDRNRTPQGFYTTSFIALCASRKRKTKGLRKLASHRFQRPYIVHSNNALIISLIYHIINRFLPLVALFLVELPLSPLPSSGFSVSPQAVRANADTIANVNVSRTIKNFLFISLFLLFCFVLVFLGG